MWAPRSHTGPTLSPLPCLQIEFCPKSTRTMLAPLHSTLPPPLHVILLHAAPGVIPSSCSSTPHSRHGPAPPAHSPIWSTILCDAPVMACPKLMRRSGAARQGVSQLPSSSAFDHSLPQRSMRKPKPSSAPASHRPGPPPPPRQSACSAPTAHPHLARSRQGSCGSARSNDCCGMPERCVGQAQPGREHPGRRNASLLLGRILGALRVDSLQLGKLDKLKKLGIIAS
jgi:hypothetical protein